MTARILLVLLMIGSSMLYPLLAQNRNDSTRVRLKDSKLSKRLIKTVTRKSPASGGPVKNQKSEDVFMPYEGKIIRKIIIRRIGFERSIYDTTRTIRNSVTRIANSLHKDTRESVIRDNLFIRPNRSLNPYRLADNERYLRDLDFILDSKFVVHPVANTDSVDVEVITRDVFSLGVRPRLGGIDKITVGLYDANLMGYGQRIQTNVLFEGGRTPFVGYDLFYRKSSIAGTLINGTVAYTQLNNGASVGEENEYAYYLRLDRPLVSPYSRFAGGLEISKNWSRNVFNEWDSLFADYRYDVRDMWVGYNIGMRNKNFRNRNRRFIAVRYFNQEFNKQPLQPSENVRRIYNNQRFLLGELTFYNQNFYKTNYVYGFGRTEDIPYGQTINFTMGWSEEVGLRRTYAGMYVIRRVVRPSGRFFDLEAGAGAFFDKDNAEDGTIYFNGTYYSKVYEIRRSKVRHQLGGGYAKAFNNRVRDLLTLNNELRGFTADSLFGYQRLYARTETTVFTRGEIAGFRFAPFMSLEGSFFQRDDKADLGQRFYWGATGGIRIRNENLIFGTVEFRAYCFPTRVRGVDPVAFKITTNIRIKYSGSFVRPPDFVRYN